MEIYLKRKYYPTGTNGQFFYNGQLICEAIELPWRANKRSISCIPEGRYQLIKRMHTKHGLQIAVVNVPNREGILIHPANFALRELQGCIAPVTKCTTAGEGNYSRIALERLQALIDLALVANEKVWLIINSLAHE